MFGNVFTMSWKTIFLLSLSSLEWDKVGFQKKLAIKTILSHTESTGNSEAK